MLELAIQTAWEGPPQCEQCGIRHLVLFSRLEKEDFALIHEPIDEIRFGREGMPYRTGEASDYVFTIREGVVKLVHYSEGGAERIVRLLKRGDVMGLEALLGQPYHHHAVVLDPALTCRIPVTVVNHLSRALPHFHYELLTRWQRAVDEADTWLTELGTGPVKARVARLLLQLAGAESSNRCFMPTREDMGAMLGVTTESVSRVTAEFKRAGLIEYVAPSRVRVHAEALQQLAA